MSEMIKGNGTNVSSDKKNLETAIEFLQRDVADMQNIHIRLDKSNYEDYRCIKFYSYHVSSS